MEFSNRGVMKFSNRFPFWVFERDPGEKYEIQPSRKLFGKQRYGLAKVDGVVNKKDDYKSEEEAKPWLNSLNIYAEVWTIFDNGDIARIKKMEQIISGDKVSEEYGYSDKTILASVLHSKPLEVYTALQVVT